jgi:hypothetical protein
MSEHSLAIRQALGVERLGEIMYKSGYWQDTRSQSQAIVKILRGAELEIGPIASMDGVYIIEGKTSLNATLMASLIQRSGRYRYKVVEHDDTHCIIDFYEIVGGKRDKLGTSSYSLEDAKKAELLGKRTRMWEKYPRNMVFSRALSNGAKWYTPDVFNGPVYTPDELGAEVDAEGNMVEVYEPPAAPAEPSVPTRERDVQDAPRPTQERMISSAEDRVWKRWEEVRSEAMKYGIVPPNLVPPVGYNQLISQATLLKAKIEAKQAQLDREEAARDAAKAEVDPSEAQPALPDAAWARNRELMQAAYEAGYKLRDLPGGTSLDEVEVRNAEIEQLLEARSTAS